MRPRTKRRLEVVLFITISALTVLLFVSFRSTATSFEEELERSADFDSTTWREYKSVEYDVSFRYPERWELVVSTDPRTPYVRVMAPHESGSSDETNSIDTTVSAPYAQVTIFPKGIPLSFQTAVPTSYSLFEQSVRMQARRSSIFTLEDGTRFAELYRYETMPVSWSPSGFVWGQSDVRGIESHCNGDVSVVSSAGSRCDLLFGDTVVYSGYVRSYDMELVDAIVSSIRFYGNVQSELGSTTVAHITTPVADAYVRNPLRVRGVAPSSWFFEDEIPIRLLDGSGVVIVETSAHVDEEYEPSSDSIPFSAVVQFLKPDTRSGTLIVEKANPSGAPQLSEQVRIPVLF